MSLGSDDRRRTSWHERCRAPCTARRPGVGGGRWLRAWTGWFLASSGCTSPSGAAGGHGIEVALGALDEVAAQVRFGVLTGRALEAGQVGGNRQPQLVSERPERGKG